MGIASEPAEMPCEVIVDGKIAQKNLSEIGLSRQQLDDELKRQGISDVKTVLYAEFQQNRGLYIQKRG